MTISKDLFLALLSMDSYNRGYGAGISDNGPNDPDGLGGENSLIGNARVIRESDVNEGSAGVEAGFYAVAYEITDGSQIDGLETGDMVISGNPRGRGADYADTRPKGVI